MKIKVISYTKSGKKRKAIIYNNANIQTVYDNLYASAMQKIGLCAPYVEKKKENLFRLTIKPACILFDSMVYDMEVLPN